MMFSLRPEVARGQATAISMRPLAASIRPARTPRARSHRLPFVAAAAFLLVHLLGSGAQTLTSGRASLKNAPSGAHQRWTGNALTVTLDPSLDALGAGSKDAIRAAAASWLGSVDTLPRLTLDVAKETATAKRDGVSRVLAAPITVPGHEHDVAVTIGYADADTGAMVEADIVFNTQYVFDELDEHDDEHGDEHGDEHAERAEHSEQADRGSSCGDVFDLTSVATHEFGHFFGLGEDMTDTNATMYFKTGHCETHKRVLTTSDKEVMTSLYERSSSAPSTARVASGCAGR